MNEEHKIEVLATGTWIVHHGIVGSNTGITGQVTKLRIDGTLCYVRENIAGKGFTMSANARMGMKRGVVQRKNEILELCCDGTDSEWIDAALAIAAADSRSRPVVPNQRFTAKWAEAAITKATGK